MTRIIFSCEIGRTVLVFESIPIERKWRDIFNRMAVLLESLLIVQVNTTFHFHWNCWVCLWNEKWINCSFLFKTFLSFHFPSFCCYCLGITPGITEYWTDGSETTSDIKILTGELSYHLKIGRLLTIQCGILLTLILQLVNLHNVCCHWWMDG